MEESNLFLSTHRPLVVILGGLFLFVLIIVPLVKEYFSPVMRKERKTERERREKERIETAKEAEKMRKIVQEIKQQEAQSKKEEELNKYQQLRKEIEAMPEYEHWRQAVFKERGRKCSECGLTEDLEIDHRFKSFSAIIKEYGIRNTIQAYECPALWSVDNGAPLCKKHHGMTSSNVYRILKNNLS